MVLYATAFCDGNTVTRDLLIKAREDTSLV